MMVLCNWGKFGKEVRGLAIGPGSRVLDDSIPLRRGFNARGEDSHSVLWLKTQSHRSQQVTTSPQRGVCVKR